jgi:hypothetical protein
MLANSLIGGFIVAFAIGFLFMSLRINDYK